MLQLGIIGLPLSGKTTVFNAISGSHAAVGDYSLGKTANIAVVKVPDKRLERLIEIFEPKKITHAEIEYIDIAGLTHDGSDKKKEAGYVHAIRQTDALLHVVRCFENPNVPHPAGSIDPGRDIADVDSELILQDLIVVEGRIEKISRALKIGKKDDEALYNLLLRCREELENGRPLRNIIFTSEEKKMIGGYRLLSGRPVLYILNLDESQCHQGQSWEDKFEYLKGPLSGVSHICALLQMDIASFTESERTEFMSELGIEELASATIVRKSFELLGLIAFLTGGPTEVHSWPIHRGITAHLAAGEVHSDIQRGFIRAEVVSYADLDRLGSWAHARDEGKLHLHGKDYVVQDGDVILFRFNV
jgi:GTP-binding protein YchF